MGTYGLVGQCAIEVIRAQILELRVAVQHVINHRQKVETHGQHFWDRCFTKAEQEYCAKSPRRYYEHLARRFAAKEAVLKVLGTGWRGGIAWTDVEVVKEPSGQPKIVLTGESLKIANELGIAIWHISISHIETHATASAIGSKAK